MICFVVMDEGRWRLHVRHVFRAVSASQRMGMFDGSKASPGVHLRVLFGVLLYLVLLVYSTDEVSVQDSFELQQRNSF